jgi:hypothetical protein
MAEHRFFTPEPLELEIKVPVGEIEVETIDGTESLVTLEGNERLIEQTTVEQHGNRLIVETRGKSGFGITISLGDFSIGNGRLYVRARVPHHSRAVLETASADMALRGQVKSLETRSASGDLVVTADVARDAVVKTVSGDVRLQHVGGDLQVQSVSGDVVAGDVGGSIRLKSVSGDMRVERVQEGELTAQSVSGDIAVGIARGTKLDVDAGSVSGDLTSEVPLGSDPGALGGEGPTLVVRGKTVSGDFRVFRCET